ncbi:MAG: hypothetical protein SOY33_03750 [Candidatus Onthovivens sp.]|nr:hypothetical protein [Bacilli bacterium]
MKKRKILMLTLPLVGVATIVGSGFSAWYFDNTEIGTSKNVGITVTEKHVASGTLTTSLTGNEKLVLDQGGSDEISREALNKNIYVVNGSETINSFTTTFTIEESVANNLLSSRVKAHLALNVTVNSTLDKYIEVTTSNINFDQYLSFNEAEGPLFGGKLTLTKEVVESVSVLKYTLTTNIAGSTVSGSPFAYDETNTAAKTGKPVTESHYDAMVTALTGMADGLKFTASVEFEPY